MKKFGTVSGTYLTTLQCVL